jgi:GSCFA family
MKLMLDITIPAPETRISYKDKLLLIGSCFTEHIGDNLAALKFNVLQNPNGILFDPASVITSLGSYIDNKRYREEDLFFLNELWQSWQHHSRFSGVSRNEVLKRINGSVSAAHDFLTSANWLVITLGSAFSYRLVNKNMEPVANCHRAPANWFDKHLMTIEEIITRFDGFLYRLFQLNPNIRIVFTISPVRHIRDGVIDNNRSKARLIESVHHLVNKFSRLYYFPAYELVIDVLRDHRFYDVDLVHPNYQATNFVLDHFIEHYADEESKQIMKDIQQIVAARRHRALQPDTEAHQKFLSLNADKARELMKTYPFLDLREELKFFER